MDTNLVQDREVFPQQRHTKLMPAEKLRALLLTWELYPILFITAFLRLYRIDTAVYGYDEAVVYRLARDLFTHGLLPITSNRASLGNLNPPLVVYLFMIPAAISGNPFWAEVMVGLFNSAAVLLTYFFTRRYYGRLAGTTAALLYATAVKALIYSRTIWPQNLLPLFTILLMFFLFRGVIERRKGWVVPSVALIAILYQLHGSGLLMVIPFALAVVFAYKTIRWNDILLSVIVVLLLFAPFLYWEYVSHWSDIHILISASKSSPGQTDTQAIEYYRQFLSPYVHSLDVYDHYFSWPTHPDSIMTRGILHYFKLPLFLEFEGMWLLLHCSLFAAVMLVLIPQRKAQPEEESTSTVRQKNMLFGWWSELCATPSRQGLILLLSWQAALLTLLRHSITLFPHYFIIFLPGQFILIAIFTSKVIEFFRSYRPDCEKAVRYGAYILVILITMAQLIGSTGSLIDTVNDHFKPGPDPWWPGYNDLSSVQHLLTQADQLAQARHIHRIYIPVTYTTANPIRELAEGMKTPVTTFDTHYCMVLPDPGAGPAIFISDTANTVVNRLLARYTNAVLISQVKHLDNPSFTLYVLTARPQVSPAPRSFTSDLQLLEQRAFTIPLPASNQQWLVTHWRLANSTTPMPLTTNNFQLQIQSEGTNKSNDSFNFTCATTASRAGDQIMLYQVRDQSKIPTSIRVQASSYTSSPANYFLGPLTLTTFNIVDTPHKMLKTAEGENSITLPVS